MKTIVDIHVIQTVPPSCINRDDNNRPKTAIYGGAQRARVSSQAWKKAVRDEFRERLGKDKVGFRTVFPLDLIKEKLIELGINEDDAKKRAEAVLHTLGIKTSADKKTGATKTSALFFISPKQVDALAKEAANFEGDPKKVVAEKEAKARIKKLSNKDHTLDIALFGRMVADDPTLNCDAACQVAHAISVDEVNTEFDFFTAVDDVKDQDIETSDAGSGHLGVVEYNSSTLYRYATIYVDQLLHNLNKDKKATAKAVKEFLRAFAISMPTGKINTFANDILPQLVLVTIRQDQPVNLVTAFENPIYKREGSSISDIATQKLANEYKKVHENYVNKPETAYVISLDEFIRKENRLSIADAFEATKVTLEDLLSGVEKALDERLAKSEDNDNE
ncbi:MAG: type I-E CRISPR-associated protein Cas7/Cse4/CasC [Candidatus Ancillula sp.]|jgi:CRISPR system Cascade subunit CasC|nr:type I-E CRISPR-associated protein Cas7/Cse4/CasC [Candidatus Ancillula sp.]